MKLGDNFYVCDGCLDIKRGGAWYRKKVARNWLHFCRVCWTKLISAGWENF